MMPAAVFTSTLVPSDRVAAGCVKVAEGGATLVVVFEGAIMWLCHSLARIYRPTQHSTTDRRHSINSGMTSAQDGRTKDKEGIATWRRDAGQEYSY
jgi:ribosome-binding protein aMBF1 (putative translation factor)